MLLTEDLARNILEYLAVDPRSDWDAFSKYSKEVGASRKQLYRAAFISRCFVHPALSLLWRTMDSVKPLIELLPKSLLSQNNGEYMVLHKRSEKSHDLQRFTYYARMVEAFCLKQPPEVTLKLPVYHALAQDGVPMPLFPRLHTLHIDSLTAAAEDPLLFHLLSPYLRRVMISSYTGPEIMHTILSTLLRQAPDLHYFRSHAQLPRDMTEWVLDFDQLRKLRLDFPFDAIYQPESGLNHLTHLTHLFLDFGAVLGIPDSVTIPCEALTNLTITCRRTVAFSLLEALELPNIREARLSLCPHSNPIPGNCFIFASIRRWARTLEALTIDGGRCMPLSAIYQDTRNTKVSKFKCLKYFEVYDLLTLNSRSAPKCEELDFPLSTLASILPNVEHLSLPPAHQIISYNTLCMVLVSCQQLKYLQIGIDAQTFPPDKLRRNTFPFGVLERLSVGDGNDFEPFTIAHHLLRLFPYLKTVISPSERWSTVNKLVDFTGSLEVDKWNHPEMTPELLREFKARWSFMPNIEP
ncbi:hypothetical protein BDN72DRAFT_892039 [Pluteus cervinus]|uniref:Uncharacterized protein n=1 Tax=Pluteus cervinus TaxID=181527 RepID=A0ACD3BBT4_9AGAR|nr:hypothetical protein BDN72DRAFT_892039 [Pluteus cervinus]